MANDVFDLKQHFRVQYSPTSGTWTNIVTDTYEVSIDRGIAVEQGVFARPDVGTAEIRLIKTSLADMLNGPGYKSNMPIRIQFQLLPDTAPTAWSTLFYGLIQNVSMSYQVDTKKLAVTITANDFMKVFLNTPFSNYLINVSSQSLRSFIRCMDNLGTAVSALDSRLSLTHAGSNGSSTTQWNYTWATTTGGQLASTFLDAELGWLYCPAGSGSLQYYTRGDINDLQATTWNTSSYTVSNVHSNDITHFCMDNIDFVYDSDALVNKVTVTESYTSATSTASNSTSITNYGTQSGQFEIQMDNTGLSTLGNWASHVANAANPKLVKSVSVPAIRRDGVLSLLLTLDIADTLQVEFASTGLTTMQEIHLITRMTHNITAEHWEVNVGLWRGI
jgi:hypothetical protein